MNLSWVLLKQIKVFIKSIILSLSCAMNIFLALNFQDSLYWSAIKGYLNYYYLQYCQMNKQMFSSLSLNSQTQLDKQQTRKVNIILKALLEHNEAYDFKQPVDWKGMNLTDYPSIVKNPMDLGTIEKNLKHNKYKYVEEFLDHVQLIWDNCKLYNMAGSWIYEVAEKIQRNFKKMIKNYFPDIPIVIPQKVINNTKNQKRNLYENLDLYTEEDITYFQKLAFSEKIQKLDEEQLQKLIKWIQEKCPNVLREVNEERVQILVDNFTQVFFQQASEILFTLAEGQIDKVSKKVKIN